MAQNTNNKELRQQALREIAEGREEISAEVQHMREHLSPVRVLKRVVRRHSGTMMLLAATAGMVPALLLFRGKRPQSPAIVSENKLPPKPVIGALLVGALGMLAKSVTPALIKSTIIPHVLDFIAKRNQPPASTRTTP